MRPDSRSTTVARCGSASRLRSRRSGPRHGELVDVRTWDAELYRAVFPFPGLGQWDVEVYTALARAIGGPVLELGCGTGRIVSALLQAGIDADGLELDPSMRSAALRRLTEQGVSDAAQRVVLADMRQFAVRRRYSLVLLPDNSVSMLELDADVDATLRCVRDHLREGGQMVLDHTLLERAGKDQSWPERDVDVEGVRMHVVTTGRYNEKRRLYELSIRAEADGAATRRLELRLRQRTPAEIVNCLSAASFHPCGPAIDERGRRVDEHSHVFIGRFTTES